MTLGADNRLERTSWGALHRDAELLAGRLHELGVGAGRTVAILMPNSARWVTAYLSVLRLGAVAVPLEHDMLEAEPERLRFALEHSEAQLLIAEEGDLKAAERIAPCPAICAQEVGSAPPPKPAIAPDDLAQILYTSGTTGPRKGVELTHRNIAFNARRLCRRFGVTPRDCVPALLPYHHAYPLTATVVLPLYAGARTAVGDIRDRRSRHLLRRSRPTVLVAVPRVLEGLLESVENAAERSGRLEQFGRARRLSRRVKSWTRLNLGKLIFRGLHIRLFGGLQLRFAVSGGARISPTILRRFFVLGVPVLQGWGMSEISPVGAVQEFRPFRFYCTGHYERKAGSIGRPLDGTRIEFTQSSVEELSFDLEHWGEMLVRGPHVMRGYHKDPDRTRRQMMGDALRTGDIARRDEEGNLYIVGRTKHVIVLPNGKKVFPEQEVDERLSRCSTIEEFAVRPIEDARGNEKIGIILRPNLEQVQEAETLAELYRAIKKDIDRAFQRGPAYLKQYGFCLTAWEGEDYAELVKGAMGEPSPLRNQWNSETAWSERKDSSEPTPWRR